MLAQSLCEMIRARQESEWMISGSHAAELLPWERNFSGQIKLAHFANELP